MKDWMRAVEEEIERRQYEAGRLSRVDVAGIVAKHCPFEPDALYMKVVPQAPGHVYDWAAKCGAYLHAEGVRLSSHRIAAVVAHFAEPLVKLLREAKREHHHVADGDIRDGTCCPQCCCQSWPDDPESDFEPTPNGDEPCTCGADKWNAKIDAVLQGEEP